MKFAEGSVRSRFSETHEGVHDPASAIREGATIARNLYRSRSTVFLDGPVRRTGAIQYHSVREGLPILNRIHTPQKFEN
jgi:hypothetical protein